ncbi:mandelate racemase/muconate lactonizing enzyme family protein [Sphingomonas sp. AR_OL41]|uniref:mandelate racemase/muconate lactonizing enzyme family protein n=1 Tax=Sphingomonas sp. AR_OL41 TaxID=3042729 RepID=UPI002480F991|nr:mandelate racemase/muconate lactonizing enzyme family protein [Sphingomonas sp. AR_OL41]MDH7973911.1 mandelate racemase/muconate lactonizing enzyme family protein [Sphingomonas sp. AR_OL41]
MASTPRIKTIEVFSVRIPQDDTYLGGLGPGESINDAGYLVRRTNRTIYPAQMKSAVVRVTLDSGDEGWGETYGLVAPLAIHALVTDVIAPIIAGRSPFDVQAIWEDLYDLMRVRGYTGGFWLDALAAVDIALWDLMGKLTGQPLNQLLGGRHRERIPAYVSGLPAPTIAQKVDLAKSFVDKGFSAVKIAASVSYQGVEREIAALRDGLGPDVAIMLDCHWMYSPAEAVALLHRLAPYNLYFLEAPCKTEDVAGLADIAAHASVPIAAGEEWRTVFDARSRLEARAVAIVQPEMGHTGITQFMRIAQLTQAFHGKIIPHATIGVGIFAAASLQASSTVLDLPWHEYQHSIFHHGASLMDGGLSCSEGYFAVPEGVGLGVVPNDRFWENATLLG